jgi:DNA-binding Xre family transcriptional regulator
MGTRIDTIIGARVRGRRLILALSLRELAFKIGIPLGDLDLGEAGKRRFSAKELLDLTVALDCNVGDLLAQY